MSYFYTSLPTLPDCDPCFLLPSLFPFSIPALVCHSLPSLPPLLQLPFSTAFPSPLPDCHSRFPLTSLFPSLIATPIFHPLPSSLPRRGRTPRRLVISPPAAACVFPICFSLTKSYGPVSWPRRPSPASSDPTQTPLQPPPNTGNRAS